MSSDIIIQKTAEIALREGMEKAHEYLLSVAVQLTEEERDELLTGEFLDAVQGDIRKDLIATIQENGTYAVEKIKEIEESISPEDGN